MSDAPQSLPSTVNWSAPSPRGLAIATQVALRLSAGYDYTEVAAQIESDRDNIRDLDLPPGPVERELVAKLLKTLRDEIRRTEGAAEY